MKAKSLLVTSILLTSYMAQAQGTTAVNSISVNGVLNPTYYTGADIGAQVNTAFAALAPTGGTVRIPSGVYKFSTTINHPGSQYKLECDAGTTLYYTGSTSAIAIPTASTTPVSVTGPGGNATIDGIGGCILDGSKAASGANGVHILFSSGVIVKDIQIQNFGNNSGNIGNGIFIDGANTVELTNLQVRANTYGIYMQQSNAIHLSKSGIAGNSTYGLYSSPSSGGWSWGNVYRDNVFESNGVGDILLDNNDAASLIEGDYFEGSEAFIMLGVTQNVWGVNVRDNIFVQFGANPPIEVGWGNGFNLYENTVEVQNPSTCFINIIHANANGSFSLNHRGVGTTTILGNIATVHEAEWCAQGTPTTTP